MCLAASEKVNAKTSGEDKKTIAASQPPAKTGTSPSPVKPISSLSTTPLKTNLIKETAPSTPQRQSRNERRPLAERMRPTTFEDIMVQIVCRICFREMWIFWDRMP